MRIALPLTVLTLVVAGCNDKKPEAIKPPVRYKVESQRADPYVVTIWSTEPLVTVGSNVFKLQFQTAEKQPADPGKVAVEPMLAENRKSPIPGHAEIRDTEQPGVYEIAAELPTSGRWKFNVAFGSHSLAFYYNATEKRERGGSAGVDAHEAGRSR